MIRAWAVAGCLGVLSAGAFGQQESVDEVLQWVIEKYDYFGPAIDIVEDVLTEPDPTGTMNAKISDRAAALMMGVKAGYLFSQGRDAEAWRSLRNDAIRLGINLAFRYVGLGPLNTVIAFVELYIGFFEYVYNQLNQLAIQNQTTFYNACRSQGMTHVQFMARPDETPDGTPLVWDDRGWIIYYGSTRNHIFPQTMTASQLFGMASGSYVVKSQDLTGQVQNLGALLDARLEQRLRGSNRIRLTGERFAPTRYTLTGDATPPEGASVTGYEWRSEAGTLLFAGNVFSRNAYQVGDQTLRGRALFSNGNYNENPFILRTYTPRIDLTRATDPRHVTFNVHQSEAIQSVSWDFGDGTTGSGISVAKSYDDFGGYVVRATITAVDGSVVQTEPLNYQAGVGGPTRIDIPYTVTGTEVWHRHGSPYIIEENVTVAPGARLILEEGAVLKFGKKQGNNFFPRYLQVQGTLEYTGTAQRPVVLTSVNDDTIRGDVNGDGPGGTLDTGGVESSYSGGAIEGTHMELRRGIQHTNNGGQLRLDSATILGYLNVSGVLSPSVVRSRFVDRVLALTNCESPSVIDNTFGGYALPTTPVALYNCRGIVDVRGNGATPGSNNTRPAALVYNMGADLRLKKSDWVYFLSGWAGNLGEGFLISNGHTLTLDPGVVVKASDGGSRHGLPFFVQGTLNAVGTASDPVVFASGDDATVMGDTLLNGGNPQAQWSGIQSQNAQQVNLRFAHIHRGLVSSNAHLLLQDSRLLNSYVSIHGTPTASVTRNFFLNAGLGISHSSSFSIAGNEFVNATLSLAQPDSPSITGNIFRDYPLPTTPVYLDNPRGSLTVLNNTTGSQARPAVHVYSMGAYLRLKKSDWVYFLNGWAGNLGEGFLISNGHTLTLDPGVVVKASDGGSRHSLPIFVQGSLNAVGTASEPVIFASGDDASVVGDTLLNGGNPQAQWNGIQSQSAQQVNLRFAHIHRGAVNANENLLLQDSRLLNSSVSVIGTPMSSLTRNFFLNGGLSISNGTNLILSGNEFVNGVLDFNRPDSVSINDNSFRDYAVPTTPIRMHEPKGSITVVNNAAGLRARKGIHVHQMGADLRLRKSDWAYLMDGQNPGLGPGFWVPAGRTLTVDPGVVIKSTNGAVRHDLPIFILGRLIARGTSNEPVFFLAGNDNSVLGDSLLDGGTSVPYWYGLRGNSAEQIKLRHVHIRHGGVWSNSTLSLQDSNMFMTELVIEGTPTIPLTRNLFVNGTVSVSRSKGLLLTANDFENAALNLYEADSPRVLGNMFRAFTTPMSPVFLQNCRGTITINDNTAGQNARPSVVVSGMGASMTLTKSDWAYVLNGWAGNLGEGFLIPQGRTLSLEGGATVKVGTDTQDRPLFVEGTLEVDALAQKPAIITDLADDSAAGDTLLDGPSARRSVSIHAPSATSKVLLQGAEIRRGAGTWRGLVQVGRSVLKESNFILHGGPPGSRLWSSVLDRSTFSVGLGASLWSSHLTVTGNGSGLQYIGARGHLRNSIAQFSPIGFLRLESLATQTHNVIWQSGSLGSAFPPNGTEMFLDPLLMPATWEPFPGSPVIGAGLLDPTARYDLFGRPRLGNGSRGAVEPGGADPLVFVSLRLADFVGDPSAYPFQVLIREEGTGTVLFEDEVLVDSAGFFSLPVGLSGQTEIFVSGRTFLRKRVVFSPSPSEVVRVELVNGDVNGDNEVGAADFSMLAAAYDAVIGDPNFVDGADLNGDGEVGAADFSILAAAYDRVGD